MTKSLSCPADGEEKHRNSRESPGAALVPLPGIKRQEVGLQHFLLGSSSGFANKATEQSLSVYEQPTRSLNCFVSLSLTKGFWMIPFYRNFLPSSCGGIRILNQISI